jgi:hypothetical protein
MRIGSDEIILWIRKNNKAEMESNEILGKKIRNFIRDTFEINPIEYNQQSYWLNKSDDKNIGAFNLPKTSAQYDLDIEHFTELYGELSNW